MCRNMDMSNIVERSNLMKICFMCDLHLPFCQEALQYDVLKWAVEDVKKKQPDCIAFVGDVTCDGNEKV